jgi:hypothetical protein
MPIDVKSWYGHGSKSTLINPRLSIVILPNIKGWTLVFRKIFYGWHCCVNAPFNWRTPSSLQIISMLGKTLILSIVGHARSLWSLVHCMPKLGFKTLCMGNLWNNLGNCSRYQKVLQCSHHPQLNVGYS